jgi:hypothetical protein
MGRGIGRTHNNKRSEERYSVSVCIGSWQSPHTKDAFGFAQAFRPQDGQVCFVLLASFFFLIKATV